MLGYEVACCEVPEEADFSGVAEPGAQEVDHLGYDQDGHQQRTRMGLKEVEAFRVVIVIGIDVGVQRAGID